MRAMTAWAARAGPRLAAGAALLLMLAGVPTGLAAMLGWPLPTSVPSTQAGWEQLLTAPIPDTAILRLLGIAAWLLWAMFAHAVWIEARAALHGVRAPGSRNPLRVLAALLVAIIALGWVATAAPAATPAAAATAPPSRAPAVAAVALPAGTATLLLPRPSQPVPAQSGAQPAPTLPAGPAVLVVNGCPHVYTVAKGDTLWHIADKCLGDPTRWPEIWQLNEGRFWPAVSGYKTLDNPDLIYPRWTLTLPADATAPPGVPARRTGHTPDHGRADHARARRCHRNADAGGHPDRQPYGHSDRVVHRLHHFEHRPGRWCRRSAHPRPERHRQPIRIQRCHPHAFRVRVRDRFNDQPTQA